MPELTTQLKGAIRDVNDPLIVMQRVVDQAIDLIAPAHGAIVGMASEDELTYLCAAGTLVDHVGTRQHAEESLSGLAIRSGETLWCDDARAHGGTDAQAFRAAGAASAVCVPLLRQDETIGVLTVTAPQPGAFSEGDVSTLSRLAGFISVAIGAMLDLSQVTRELLDTSDRANGSPGAMPPRRSVATPAAAPAFTSTPGRSGEHERIGEFVANVLRPGLVADLAIRHRIERVLERPSVTMRCQPIVDVRTGDLVGAEALARFPRPQQPADVWFNQAERAGLGSRLQLAAVGVAVGLVDELPGDAFLTINVGPDVIAAPELIDLLDQVDSERIVLELTEHLQIDDYSRLHDCLGAVRERGTRLAIDDTGAGFASLGHIVNLGPELIKLDRQFTRGIDGDRVRRAMAAALVGFARDVGAEVVSEGIETAAELEVVRELGIPYGQGYYIGRPMAVGLLSEHFAHARAGAGNGAGARAAAGAGAAGAVRHRR